MNDIERKVIDSYIPCETSLRQVALECNIDHHRVKRILEKYDVKIVKAKLKPFSDEHRKNISISCKGRVASNKGSKSSDITRYKNMISHIRFDITYEWISQFDDIDKIITLNRCITNRDSRWDDIDTEWYIRYIEKFYVDENFNLIYNEWTNNGKGKWKRPSIDHIKPLCVGGNNALENIQILTWLENRCKVNIPQDDWTNIKQNIKEYFI